MCVTGLDFESNYLNHYLIASLGTALGIVGIGIVKVGLAIVFTRLALFTAHVDLGDVALTLTHYQLAHFLQL